MTTAVAEAVPGQRTLRPVESATINRRVVRILALPAVVVLVLLAVVAGQQVQGFRGSQQTERSVRLTLAVGALVHHLQTERGVVAAVLGGNPSFRNELPGAVKDVEAQRVTVSDLARGGGDVEARLRDALQQLDGLPAVRAAVDGATAARAATFTYYTRRITSLLDLDLGLDRVSDDELRRASSALRSLEDLSEATSSERAFLIGVFSAGGFGKGEFVQFAAMRTARDAALADVRRVATPAERASLDFVFTTGAARTTAYFEQVALAAADGRHIIVNPQSWWSGQTTVLDDVLQLQRHVGSTIQIRAHDLADGAATRLVALAVLVIACLGGSVALAVLATLSITRPLAALAAEADEVATRRLPDAMRRVLEAPEARQPSLAPVRVPERATREISSVATALDRLQHAAYGLATDQAMQRQRVVTSLANLGRRSQNLIRRQLGFITRLEREEMDPTALANLFELDHLATRMRRNASSLLVLVGESGPRQWASPVATSDVIRAAVSEVEEYRRVALRRVDDVLVTGTAVGGVVHLLSELIENALTFSPPDSEVEVQGRVIGDSYLIAMTDQGVGMSAEDLRVANARLRGEGDFLAAPTKFLGHFVVGELARTHGIDVELVPSPVIGVTARVTLPAAVLSSRVAVEVGPSHPALSRAGEAPTGVPTAVPTAVPIAAPTAVPAPWTDEVTVTDPADEEPATATTREVPLPFPSQDTGPIPVGVGTTNEAAVTGGHRVIDLSEAEAADAADAAHVAHAPGPSPFGRGFAGGWDGRAGTSAWDHWSGEVDRTAGGPAAPGRPGTPGHPTSDVPAHDVQGQPERTRNGLAKRVPRATLPTPRPTAWASSAAPDDAPVVDGSPAEIRARLVSLRSGVRRGQGTPAADPQTWPDRSTTTPEDS